MVSRSGTAARRLEIVRAARDSFVEHGFDGASLRDIAARAGMSHVGLSHHFRSKDELLLAVLEQRDEQEGRRGPDGADDPSDVAGFLAGLLREHEATPELMRLWAELTAAAARPDHAAHGYLADRYARARAAVADQLGFDGGHRAAALLALMDGLQLQWLLDPSLDIAGALEEVAPLLLRGPRPVRTRASGGDGQRAAIADAIVAHVTANPDRPPNVTDIAPAAGISRKTFYKYFDSVDDAIVHAQEQVLTALAPDRRALAAEAPNGRENLLAILLEPTLRALLDKPHLVRFVGYFDFSFRLRGLSPERLAAYNAFTTPAMEEAVRAFEVGQRDGSIRADLDPQVTLLAVGHAVSGLAQRLAGIESDQPPDTVEAILRLEIDVWRRFLTP